MKPTYKLSLLICTLFSLPCMGQVKYMPKNGFAVATYSEFSHIPPDSLKNKQLLLAETKNNFAVTTENTSDTLVFTQDTAVIMRLLRLNNALAAWFNKNIMEGGDYFFTDLQAKTKIMKMHYYRLYLYNEAKQQFDVYYLGVNMATDLFRMAGITDAGAPAFFANTKTWNRGIVAQKHLLTSNETATAVPAGAKKIFADHYYYCPTMIDVETDGMEYSSIIDTDWKTFRESYKMMPAKNKNLAEADKKNFTRYTVHYLLP